MTKQLFTIIVVITLALVGVLVFTKDKDSSNGGNTSVSASEHTVGAGNKKVTLIEYGDFECPACKSYYPLVKAIKETYKDDIKFQFRHFPLVQIHPNAMLGSRAAEAAGNQGKFFEMHDLLYENQDVWAKDGNPTSVLESFATQLRLKMDQFKADMMSETTNNIINADRREGNAIGANSTPTFVINGKKVDKLPQTLDEFKRLIDDAIKATNPTQ